MRDDLIGPLRVQNVTEMGATMRSAEPHFRRVSHHLDDVALLAAFFRIAFADLGLVTTDLSVLAAAQRVAPGMFEKGTAGFAGHLRDMEPEQVSGLASSVKGALHEMAFVELENSARDAVFASLFDDPHHPATDVHFVNRDTGESWGSQLKATDQSAYVQDWIDHHEDGDIRVTDELAARMGLPGTGLNNADLTVQTESFLDRVQGIPDADSIWHYAPLIAPMSAAIAIHGLRKRFRVGELSWPQFRRRAIWIGGLKASRVAFITTPLATPGVNAVTATVLLVRMILNGREWLERLPSMRSSMSMSATASGCGA